MSEDQQSVVAPDEREEPAPPETYSRRSVLKFGAFGATALAASRYAGFGHDARRTVTPNATDPITLNFWLDATPQTFASDVAAYQKLNPNVKVVYHDLTFEDFDTIISSHMETHDGSYSVFGVDEPRIPQYSSKGWVVPITSPTESQLASIVLAEQLAECTYNGKVWGLPLWTSTLFMYYNKSLLAAAHVTPPPFSVSERWTWPQLYQAALAAHKSTGKAGLLFEQVNRIYQLQPLPQGLGGGPGLTGPGGLTPDIDNPGWIAAMQWYQTCFASGVTPKSITAEETADSFLAGEAAFFWGGPWDYYKFLGEKSLSFGIAPQPHWPGSPAMTPTDSWALGINPYGPYQAQALDFIQFVTTSKQGALLNTTSDGKPGNIPADLDALGQYYPLFPSDVSYLIKYELTHTAIHRARSLGWVQFETVIGEAFTSIADGSNVKAVLANAQSTLKEDFAQISA
jgi:multiple sugar transport system substrate-binding protein